MVNTSDLVFLIPILSTIVFVLGVGIFWILAFFILYHLIRFGIGTKPKKLSFIFLLGSMIITMIVIFLYLDLSVSQIKGNL